MTTFFKKKVTRYENEKNKNLVREHVASQNYTRSACNYLDELIDPR